jgi:hypothetical protein
MIKNYLEKIRFNIYGQDSVSKGSSIKEIEECEKRLGLTLPISLRELYEIFGNDKEILNAFYIFKSLHELVIEDGILIIGHSSEYVEKYGICIDDLNNASINVKVTTCDDTSNWVVYEELTKFIVNSVVFQAINSLEASAVLDYPEVTLEGHFIPLYDIEEEDNKRISYISNEGDILALHFINENVVYFGAAEDETLNEFEEQAEVDLDWL